MVTMPMRDDDKVQRFQVDIQLAHIVRKRLLLTAGVEQCAGKSQDSPASKTIKRSNFISDPLENSFTKSICAYPYWFSEDGARRLCRRSAVPEIR